MCEIKLHCGTVAIVDDCDAGLGAIRWYAFVRNHTTYARTSRTKYLHRQVMESVLGRPLERGEQVDHINGDGLDNRRENLRLASRTENNRNRRSLAGSSSAYLGVTWHKRNSKWQAQIQDGSGKRYLGQFLDEVEAARAYDAEALRRYGEFANLNFPGGSE